MAHPYAHHSKGAHKAGGMLKRCGYASGGNPTPSGMAKTIASRSGYKRGGGVHEDEAADARMITKGVHEHERALHKGEKETKLQFARGGGVKHKGGGKHVKVNVNVLAPHPGMGAGLGAGAAPVRPMPPPGMTRPPVMAGGAPGMGMGMPPPGATPPGVRPPMPGGFKRGGGLGMTAGAATGVGREEKVEIYKRAARRGR